MKSAPVCHVVYEVGDQENDPLKNPLLYWEHGCNPHPKDDEEGNYEHRVVPYHSVTWKG